VPREEIAGLASAHERGENLRMKFILSLTLFVCAGAGAAELAYRNKSKSYVLTYSSTTLRFESQGARHSIPVRACNRALLKEFWDHAEKDARKYPRFTKAPPKSKPHLRLGDEWRMLTPAVSSRLFSMEQEMMILEAKEKVLCSRK
jgi:hypothetical protein